MFSHIMLGSNNIAQTKEFYDAIIGAMGGKPGMVDDKGRLVYMHRGGMLLITSPINGEAASCANGGTVGFAASSTDEADAWHKAGVEHGGTAVEDAPGVRPSGFGPLYLAYLRDPDGNKLCAMHRVAA